MQEHWVNVALAHPPVPEGHPSNSREIRPAPGEELTSYRVFTTVTGNMQTPATVRALAPKATDSSAEGLLSLETKKSF